MSKTFIINHVLCRHSYLALALDMSMLLLHFQAHAFFHIPCSMLSGLSQPPSHGAVGRNWERDVALQAFTH